MTKKSKNPKIKYGTVNIPAEEFEPRNVKVRITMFVDGDVLDAYKAAAKKQEIGYQTLMNQKLKESLEGLDKTLADRVAAIEQWVATKQKKNAG